MRNKKTLLAVILIVIVILAAAVFLFMTNRKSADPEPTVPSGNTVPAPDNYKLQNSSVPAFPVGKDIEVYYLEPEKETEDGEAGETAPSTAPGMEPSVSVAAIYRYENVSDLPGRLEDYCKLLTREEFGFSAVDDANMKIDLPETYDLSGNVRLALPLTIVAEDGLEDFLFSLDLQWEDQRLEVTLAQISGGFQKKPEQKPDLEHRPDPHPGHTKPEPVTVAEAMQIFYDLKPEQLKLHGDSMKPYQVIILDGAVMVGEETCMRINVYSNSPVTNTNVISGMYLLNSAGDKIYKVDLDGHIEMMKTAKENL